MSNSSNLAKMSLLGLIIISLLTIGTRQEETDPTDTAFRPRPMVTVPPPASETNSNLTASSVRADVAFSVRKAVTSTAGAPATLRFKEIVINTESWNESSGEFVVPTDGGYFFTFNAVACNNTDFKVALIKNKVHQVTAYGTLGHYEHGSNSAFLELRRGDMVYLELQQGMIYDHPLNETYTTFSGFLVYHI